MYMKKSCLFFCLIFSIASFASVEVQHGLTLSQGGNSYVITYENDDIIVMDTTLIGENGEYGFSYVQLIPDYYDYVGEECSPMYPAYTLHLELPYNATNVQVSVNSLEYTSVSLHYPYLPVQSSITGQPVYVCYNPDLYNDFHLMEDYYQDWYLLSQTYLRRLAQGVDFTFYPVHYHLLDDTEVLTYAKFEITFDGDYIENLYINPEPASALFFDNYLDCEYYHSPEWPIVDGEPYLIISERQYEDSLLIFKAHKEALGYCVFLEFIDDYGSTPDAIKELIISYYVNYRLAYVLLAGSINSIPFSSGQQESMLNPPTDIYYTCLGDSYVVSMAGYHPFVYLGRWDVYNEYQLSMVMRKTIKSELSMYDNITHRVASFSGTDTPKLSNIAQAKWIETDVINASSYLTGQFYDGRYATTSSLYSYIDIKTEIEDPDSPLWMFLYFGHGSYYGIVNPYLFFYSDINDCSNSHLPYQPFGFSFACLNGDLYADNCFARSWMNVKNGGIGIMASTVESIIECNKIFSRKLFSQLVEYRPLMTIGEFISIAKERYYNVDIIPYRRNHIAKYIYLGDPSLYIHGLDIRHTFHIAPQSKDNSAIRQSNPHKVKILSTSGIFMGEVLYTKFFEQTCPSGIYILQLLDESDNIIDVVKVAY